MVGKQNIYKRRLLKWCLKVFDKLENNNNIDMFKNGEYVFAQNFMNYYKKNENLVIFDVGANLGEYTMNLCNLGRDNLQFHLFEPQKSCIKILKEKFSDESNIFLNNFGLSDTNANATIYKDEDKSGLTSLYQRELSHLDIKMDVTEKIKLKKGKNYIQKNKIEKINLLKVDVEGHEVNVFNGFEEYLDGSFIDFIQFEYGGCNIDSKTTLKEIFYLLETKGFILSKIMPKYLEVRNYKAYMENYNYSNYVAISKDLALF